MTPEQKRWLEENERYSHVREGGMFALENWADQGFLWPNGRFSVDDGQTLFWYPYDKGAIRVGKKYTVV